MIKHVIYYFFSVYSVFSVVPMLFNNDFKAGTHINLTDEQD